MLGGAMVTRITPSGRSPGVVRIVLGAAVRVADASQVFATASRLLADANAREIIRASGRAFMAAHRGATDRLWSWLAPRLAQAGARPFRQDGH